MKEKGINNTFKKIIFESAEMVFLADDTYPYNIFYANEAFENIIGNKLETKTLVGLGLDINSYVFSEELIIPFKGNDFLFQLELPQDNRSNYFLFYKGKEMRAAGLPYREETKQFFKNSPDLIGIGKENFLTWVSDSIGTILGYDPGEVINVELCQFFHPDDLPGAQEVISGIKGLHSSGRFKAKTISKSGKYIYMDWHVSYDEGNFYVVGRDIQEAEENKEKELKRRELQVLSEVISKSGVWEVELPSNKVHWSEGIYLIHELDPSFPTNLEQSFSYFFPESKLLIEKAMTELMAIGNGFDLKLRLKTHQDHEKWVQVIGKAELKENQVQKVYGTYRDISEEYHLINEMRIYKEMFELSPEAILVVDTDGQIVFTNKEANEKLGIESLHSNYVISDFEPRFEDKEAWQILLKDLSARTNKLYQTSFRKSDQSFFDVEVSVNLMEIQGREYIVAFARDITQRVSLEKSLQESSDFLLHLTEQVPGALYQFVLDKNGEMTFSYLSPGIKDLLGLDEKDFDHFSNISMAINKVHPEDMANVLTSTVASARTLKPWACQFRLKEPNAGHYKWVMGAAKPELQENGNVVWYGYLTDISEQKQFEDNLKTAREQAERASQIKSEFLSMISHELRTPLNAISGSVYSLLQEEHTTQQASALNTINFAVDNLIIMINDLLDYQKIEAGKLTLEYNAMNLKEMVNQVIRGLEFHAKDSRNNLNLYLPEELNLMVKGDKVRLAQVLNNLITNALKFTHKGDVDVTLKIKENNPKAIKVYFEVKDSGIGIAKENQHRIFNQFDQIQHSFSKKYGGTGLGLSITKKLLDQMGSQIGLESEVGQGSTFFFEVDFEKVNQEKVVSSKSNNGVASENLNHIHVLMAEDNDVNALVLGKIIKKWGINYDRVVNGQEAVEAVLKKEYDCVLMDIQMPVMDGLEATKKIKMLSDIPVLALSAAAKQDLMEKIEQAGFTGYVSKPIDASELLKKIKEVI